MRRSLISAAFGLVLLAACQDDPVNSNREDLTLHPRGEVRTGYIVGRDGKPTQITFMVVNGRAIFEGDINLGPADRVPATREQLEVELRRPATGGGPRLNSVITGNMYWWRTSTSYGGTVPYVIDPSLPNPQRVYDAMNHITAMVPLIRFVARTTEPDYVRFIPTTQYLCLSYVGKQGGEQTIDLHYDCDRGSTIHELGHALGLWHEQSRCDRDAYVEILWQNIDPAFHYAFNIHCSASTTDPNAGTDYLSYDEGSIMHYGTHYFSMNGQPTIRSRRGLDYLMGQRNGLSATDDNTLSLMYPGKRRACCSF